MTYIQRRLCRYRIVRRNACILRIKNVISTIKDLTPELIAVLGIMFIMFYIMPVFLGIIAATIR